MANNKSGDLETKLNELFTKNLPALPEGGKKALVQWAPILSLIGGVLILLSAWSLWYWARLADHVVNYANSACAYAAYGPHYCSGVSVSRLSMWVWLDLVFLIVMGLYIYSPTLA